MKVMARFGGPLLLALLPQVPLACALDGPDESLGREQVAAGYGGDEAGTTSDDSTTTTTTTDKPPAECPYQGQAPIDPSTLPPCPNCSAAGAHCLPSGLVPADFQGQLDPCDADSTCVPDYFIETMGLFIPPSCTSVAGAEGRCLNRCIPQVSGQADLLPVDICAWHEVCVPCYDPQTGLSTGACELSCDPGPAEPPTTLPTCCGGSGTCVPPQAAGSQAGQLGEDSCPQDNGPLLCAPDVFVNDPNWKPPPCETGLLSMFFGDAYKPGACLPECIPAVDSFLIGQDGCADGFKCAPCLMPPFGEPTGACDL